MATQAPSIDIRRANQRFVTRTDWLNGRHCFSFGHHYDPSNTHFGMLLVLNDDIVQAGRGFGMHPHRDMEVVTWVLDGELEHQDSAGHRAIVGRGGAQRISAGTGIYHSETNPSPSKPVHLLQMWVPPHENGIAPSYEDGTVGPEIDSGAFVPIATGKKLDSVVRIHQKGATLWVARLQPGASVTLPDAPKVHLYISQGAVDLEQSGRLEEGDSARMTAAGARRITATGGPAEIAVWELDA
jgi:hypothetical protein